MPRDLEESQGKTRSSEAGKRDRFGEVLEDVETNINELEIVLHCFRTSDVAVSLRQVDQEEFDELWRSLQDIVYRVQRLLPEEEILRDSAQGYVSGTLYESEIPTKYRDIIMREKEIEGRLLIFLRRSLQTFRDSLQEFESCLKILTMVIKRDDKWQEISNYNIFELVESGKAEAAHNLLGQSIPKSSLGLGLLTTQQWRELNDHDYVEAKEIGTQAIDSYYESLLKNLDGLEKAIAPIEEKLKQFES